MLYLSLFCTRCLTRESTLLLMNKNYYLIIQVKTKENAKFCYVHKEIILVVKFNVCIIVFITLKIK